MFFSTTEIQALHRLVDQAIEANLDGPFEDIHEKLLDQERLIDSLDDEDDESLMSPIIVESLVEHLSATASMALGGEIVAYGFAVHLTGGDIPAYGHFGSSWPLASGLDGARAIVLSKLIAHSEDTIPQDKTH